MQPTSQLWAVASLIAFLTVLSVVLARPVLLSGAVLIGAWLLGSQYSFLFALERTGRALSLTRSPARSAVRTNESTPVTIAVALEEPSPLQLDVMPGVPTISTLTDRETLRVELEPGTTARERTANVTWPIAGRHRFEAARLTATDGLFRETLAAGERPVVTVEPRGPRNIHVGTGGDRIAAAYGEHQADLSGSGIEIAELREYVPGETADRIDWKATARLNTPYVREHDASTDRRTILVIDQRATLSTGLRNETKLDYLREVALATLQSARKLHDPVGFLAVGNGGITTRLEPTGTPAIHAAIRRELLELEPTAETRAERSDQRPPRVSTDGSRTRSDSGTPRGSRGRVPRPHDRPNRDGTGTPSPTHRKPTLREIRRSVADLEGDSPFTVTLRPFYADQQRYLQRIEKEPLFGAVRTALGSTSEATWTVIFTDDSSPSELLETVSFVRRNGGEVTVFLAPTALYEPSGDFEQTYNRYLEFEEFRRELARMERTTAIEVAPGDRLATVLAQGRERSRSS